MRQVKAIGDAQGLAELYETRRGARVPTGSRTVGREAIRAVCEQMLAQMSPFELEEALPSGVGSPGIPPGAARLENLAA